VAAILDRMAADIDGWPAPAGSMTSPPPRYCPAGAPNTARRVARAGPGFPGVLPPSGGPGTFVMIGQNRQADFQQAKADHDFNEQELELKTNTQLTREIDRLTLELHSRLLDKPAR
jgi:hypothetical protein